MKRESDFRDIDEKKLRRMEKNRESARSCRLRKKEHLEKLRAEMECLDKENVQLRLKLKIGQESVRYLVYP